MPADRDTGTPAKAPTTNRSGGRQVFVAVLIAAGMTMLLRALPVFDPSIAESFGELRQIDVEARRLRDEKGATGWSRFADESRMRLGDIADELRRVQGRRAGLWKWVAGADRRTDGAMRDLMRLAESELPALLAEGPAPSEQRERLLSETLLRLDDHIAGASPYIPPLRPIENQAGLDQQRAASRQAMTVGILVAEVVAAALAIRWWVRRRRAVSAAGMGGSGEAVGGRSVV